MQDLVIAAALGLMLAAAVGLLFIVAGATRPKRGLDHRPDAFDEAARRADARARKAGL